jgi:hypothetical protein
MTYKEACTLLGDDQAFRATVYAMNTLMIQKGVYTSKEYEHYFCQYADAFKKSFSGVSGVSGEETVQEFSPVASHASR